MKAVPMFLHSAFLDNPGTGKTTVARIYGKLLNAMGILSRGHVVETDRSGLVAGYIGKTEGKTDEKVREALGGILFIDEAYSLAKGDDAAPDVSSTTKRITKLYLQRIVSRATRPFLFLSYSIILIEVL
jgi:SpoVK/Ycf46/Vps4 family AAA+-type ATPase